MKHTSSQQHASKQIEMLYIHNQQWLRSWLYKQLGCNHLAGDLLHDTFERLLKRVKTDVIEDSDAYLKTVARHLLTDHWRKKNIETAYQQCVSELEPDLAPSAEEQVEHLELLIQVDNRLRQLKTDVRQTFIAVQLEGLNYADTANRLAISISTVKRHLKQAMLSCCFNLSV